MGSAERRLHAKNLEAPMRFQFAVAAMLIALSSATASAQTAEEQQACMNDAFSVCGHAIPHSDRVEACLYENKSRIAQACRMVLNRNAKPAATTASRIKATSVR